MSDQTIPRTTRKVPTPRKTDHTDVIARRDYFAAHAPDLPDWFVVKDLPPKPVNVLRAHAEAGKIEDKDFMVINQWARGEATLPEELEWLKDEHRLYLEQRESWERDCAALRFFVWRWHYADQMVHYGGTRDADKT
jgi:hypothetical protein